MRSYGSLLLAGLAACTAPRPLPAPSRPAEVAVAPTPPAPAAPADAGPEAPAAPALDVDLLHWTRAAVNVPSRVENPHDYPEHLVDGKPETAWNSKTGELTHDLQGNEMQIHFGVPKEAWIDRIEISAGFDKRTPKGDLFTMNHRITKVAVFESSGNEKVGEFALDPNERRPQRIPVKRQGGTFYIRVLDTLPGTKKEWKELTISELLVMGDPKTARLPRAQMPTVTIASRGVDMRPTEEQRMDEPPDLGRALPVAGRSVADVCAAWDKLANPIIAAKTEPNRYPGPPAPPHCALAASPAVVPAGGATPKLRGVRAVALNFVNTDQDHLLIETDQGFVVPRDAAIRAHNRSYDLTTTTAKIVKARFEEPNFAIATIETVERFEFYCGVGDTSAPTRSSTTYIDFDLRCDLAAKPVACIRSERRHECTGYDCP